MAREIIWKMIFFLYVRETSGNFMIGQGNFGINGCGTFQRKIAVLQGERVYLQEIQRNT